MRAQEIHDVIDSCNREKDQKHKHPGENYAKEHRQQELCIQPAPTGKVLQRFKSISSGNLIDLPIEDDKKTIAERMRNKCKSLI